MLVTYEHEHSTSYKMSTTIAFHRLIIESLLSHKVAIDFYYNFLVLKCIKSPLGVIDTVGVAKDQYKQEINKLCHVYSYRESCKLISMVKKIGKR